jgi:hypothetical protein
MNKKKIIKRDATWFARSVVPTTTGKRLIDTSMLEMCNFVFNTEMLLPHIHASTERLEIV